MSDSSSFHQLQARLQDVHNLRAAGAVLSWDQEVYMPPKGAAARGSQLSTLSAQAHRLFTAPETAKLFEECLAGQDSLPSDERKLLQEAHYDYQRAVCLPEKLVRAFSEAQSQAYHAWLEARAEDDFPRFLPHLEKIIALTKEQAECLGYEDQPYDALLENYERGTRTKDIETLFAVLAKEQGPLVQAVAAEQASEKRPALADSWDVDAQRRLTEQVLADMGYDFEAGRQDVSAHPFTTNFSRGDVRVTTRYSEKEPFSALFSSIHEGGHALYEQGFLEQDEGTVLAEAPSLGIHESQSRLWENMVGRSRAFWAYCGPLFREYFPDQTAQLSDDDLYHAVNRVSPSLIRVDADECSYNLHVIVRFEIEKALFANDIAAADIPAVWAEKMKAYLGVTVPNDRLGCLQDIHWSHGAFGYFPTYALGTLYAAQIFATAKKAIPNLEDEIRHGNFQSLLAWLRSNIHEHGRRELTVPLLERACGAPLTPDSFMSYLKNKYQKTL